jgi:hypothetical protein
LQAQITDSKGNPFLSSMRLKLVFIWRFWIAWEMFTQFWKRMLSDYFCAAASSSSTSISSNKNYTGRIHIDLKKKCIQIERDINVEERPIKGL